MGWKQCAAIHLISCIAKHSDCSVPSGTIRNSSGAYAALLRTERNESNIGTFSNSSLLSRSTMEWGFIVSNIRVENSNELLSLDISIFRIGGGHIFILRLFILRKSRIRLKVSSRYSQLNDMKCNSLTKWHI